MPPVRVISWNVNGLRACIRKGFGDWLRRCRGSVVCLQEVRALPHEIPDDLRAPRRWHTHFVAARRRGYSGVALYSRRRPDAVASRLGEERFDVEGRLQIARFGRLAVANVYFPKGSGKERDNSRVPYKLDFYDAVLKRVQGLRQAGYRVLVVGDFNTAHHEIDLARPKVNVKNSGFLPEERAAFDRFTDAGWIDTFRQHHPGEPGHYTWWRQWGGAREDNVGWRIDYVLASPNLRPFLRRAFIHPHVTGSDHCPVGVDLEAGVSGGG